MSIDPMRMLQQLEAEQSNKQDSNGSQDPIALLQQLEAENIKTSNDKEKIETIKNISDNLLKKDKAIEKLESGDNKMILGLLGLQRKFHGIESAQGFQPKNFTEALAGMPEEDIAKRLSGSGPAFIQGLKEAQQGGVQMTLDAFESLGLGAEGMTKAYTKMSDKQRSDFEKEFNKKFGDTVNFRFVHAAGKIAPSLVLAPMTGGQSITAQLAAGTAYGAAISAAEYIPENSEQERWVQTIKGAGLGFLLAAGANMLPAIKNWIRGKIGKEALSTKVAKKGAALMERTGVDLKLSQITDDPLIVELEQMVRQGGVTKVAERSALKAEEKSLRQTLSYWQKTIKSIKGTTGQFGTRLNEAFKKTLGSTTGKTGLLGVRKIQADKDWAAAYKASNGEKNIPVAEFSKNAMKLISDYRTSQNSAKRVFAKELIKTLKMPGFKTGKINAKKMQDVLETYGGRGAKSGQVWKDIDPKIQETASKFLFSGAKKDLDAAIKSGAKGSKELGIARANYETNTARINDLKDSALYNLFNGKVPKTNDELVTVIQNMKPDRLRHTMSLLSKSDPGLHRELQRHWLEKSIKMKTGEIGAERFQPQEMLKLADDKKLLSIFQDRVLRKQVIDGIRLSQRVISHTQKTGGKLQSVFMQAAGVAASRDKTFIARLAADLFTPRAISGYMLSKDGIKILQEVLKAKNTNALAAALISLNNLNKEE